MLILSFLDDHLWTRCTRRLSFNVQQHFCALHMKCASSAAVIYFNTVFWSGGEQSKGLCSENTFRKCAFEMQIVLGELNICIFNHRNASWRNSPKTNQFGSISPLALCDQGMFIPLHQITQSGSVTVEQRAAKKKELNSRFHFHRQISIASKFQTWHWKKNTRWTNKKENIATLTVTHG